jgi:hypothetical protein
MDKHAGWDVCSSRFPGRRDWQPGHSHAYLRIVETEGKEAGLPTCGHSVSGVSSGEGVAGLVLHGE